MASTLGRITVDIEFKQGATPEDEEKNVELLEEIENTFAVMLNDPLGRIVSWHIHGEWPDLSEFEDERGNLWEPPDDEGRIRVRDLDGDTVTWLDPGDDGYSDAIARFLSLAKT